MSILIAMTYYYVTIQYVSKNTGLLESVGGYNMSQDSVRQQLVEPFLNGVPFVFLGKVIDPKLVEEVCIYETSKKVQDILSEQRRRRSTPFYEDHSGSVDDILEQISGGEIGRHVTSRFITSLQKIHERKKPSKKSKDVFIVHGKDHKPMKELKVMLKELGLNPIVLHEQPSGSRTIVEKLEKFSDVGYAFVILTPDDVGCLKERYLRLYNVCLSKEGERKNKRKENMEFFFRNMIEMLINRARQNVILEFGFFMGMLGRDRVCCLHRGGVELPSDMHGIVYIPFKESVNEVRNKIIKELKEAGYEMSL